MENKSLAIIVARGGSKRIPKKNIRLFLGKPIIQYSIDAALKSKCFDVVMTSTDDEQIASISTKLGAQVPFLRSKETSSDKAMISDVILEVLKKYQKTDLCFNYVCCLLPTAPFITAENLKKSFMMLKNSDEEAIIPVVKFSYPIQRALIIEKNILKMIHQENMRVNSQDLIPTYHDAGQFYWLKVESFLKQKKIFVDKCLPFEIPEAEVQDVDTEGDWKVAEVKFSKKSNKP